MKKGFTLVELSIVLVIISLLISGLLIGQNMIRSTKIQSQIKQIQQIEIAVTNFKTTYNGLPGDTNLIGDATGSSSNASKICAGNNDGKISAIGNGSYSGVTASPQPYVSSYVWGGAYPCDNQSHAEWGRVFEHLGAFGMYPWDMYVDTDATYEQTITGIGHPKMILDVAEGVTLGAEGGVVVGYIPANSDANYSFMNAGNKIVLGGCRPSSPSSGIFFYCPPEPSAMLAIDIKVDDGKPRSGYVHVGGGRYVMRADESWDCNLANVHPPNDAYRTDGLDTPAFFCSLVFDSNF
ncbi:MAG: prepilin-type N-terminal cleavage/methylation domain-containing protein [Verrucomicrobiae bacterium]|nr:prepilin-type N-terminal cleavage/methylation domain-containing protein [Verrucomicrobiae bacterium]